MGALELAPAGVMRFAITPPEGAPINLGGNAHDLAVSRDGSLVVFQSGTQPSDFQLNLRPIDQLESTPFRGTEGAVGPFFSHDGEWVGFVNSTLTTVLKVSVFGGPPVRLVEAPTFTLGWSWGANDQIVFGSPAGLFRVAGGGGEPEALTTLDPARNEEGHMWPQVIEGRDLVVFVIAHSNVSPLTSGQLAVLDLVTGEVTRLDLAGVSPRYVSTGHAANFDLSDDGRLVYAPGCTDSGAGFPTNLVSVTRDGTRALLAELESVGWYPRFAPDGSRVAYAVSVDAWGGQRSGSVGARRLAGCTDPRDLRWQQPLLSPLGAGRQHTHSRGCLR